MVVHQCVLAANFAIPAISPTTSVLYQRELAMRHPVASKLWRTPCRSPQLILFEERLCLANCRCSWFRDSVRGLGLLGDDIFHDNSPYKNPPTFEAASARPTSDAARLIPS